MYLTTNGYYLDDAMAKRLAEDPEFTIKANFELNFFAKLFSNSVVFSPIVIFFDLK